MVGIKSYGAYIPRYRLDRKVIYSAMGWLNPATYMSGEKAVANYDEDSISMAVNAGMNCLSGIDKNTVDGLYFSSVSLPYKVRQNAGIIATALDLRSDITTADITGSTKSGTTALISACNAIKAGEARNILVCAADCRVAKPGSAQEQSYGDGAVAILLGENDLMANFQGAYSVSYDFVDKCRANTVYMKICAKIRKVILICSEMVDCIDPLQCLLECGFISDITFNEFRLVRNVIRLTLQVNGFLKIIEDSHFITIIKKSVNSMGSYESGAPGD